MTNGHVELSRFLPFVAAVAAEIWLQYSSINVNRLHAMYDIEVLRE